MVLYALRKGCIFIQKIEILLSYQRKHEWCFIRFKIQIIFFQTTGLKEIHVDRMILRGWLNCRTHFYRICSPRNLHLDSSNHRLSFRLYPCHSVQSRHNALNWTNMREIFSAAELASIWRMMSSQKYTRPYRFVKIKGSRAPDFTR